MQHEDLDILAPRNRIYRGAAGIPAGRAHDGKAAVVAREKLLEQQAEQLQGHILEGKRRPVEQFEQPLTVVELDQRCHRSMREPAIGLLAQFAQTL